MQEEETDLNDYARVEEEVVSSEDEEYEDFTDNCTSILSCSAGDDEIKAIPPIPVIKSLD